MVVNAFGRVNDVILSQYSKAFAPIDVTELGILITINSVQKENAALPMLVTESGTVMCVTVLLLKKADAAILVTLYVAPPTTKLDNNDMLPVADPLAPTLASTVPTV